MPCDWLAETGRLMQNIPGNQPTVISKSLEHCQVQCMSQTAFICVAVNYKQANETCQLLAENKETASLVKSLAWQSSIRPFCAGSVFKRAKYFLKLEHFDWSTKSRNLNMLLETHG